MRDEIKNVERGRNQVLAALRRSVPYIPALKLSTGGVLSAILFQQLDYLWYSSPEAELSQWGGILIFAEPPERDNPYYKLGRSWLEQIAFSEDELKTAFNKIGTSYESRSRYGDQIHSGQDPFKGKPWLRFRDRKAGITIYKRNSPLVDLMLDNLVDPQIDREAQYVANDTGFYNSGIPVSVNGDSRFTETGNPRLQKMGFPVSVNGDSRFTVNGDSRFTENGKNGENGSAPNTYGVSGSGGTRSMGKKASYITGGRTLDLHDLDPDLDPDHDLDPDLDHELENIDLLSDSSDSAILGLTGLDESREPRIALARFAAEAADMTRVLDLSASDEDWGGDWDGSSSLSTPPPAQPHQDPFTRQNEPHYQQPPLEGFNGGFNGVVEIVQPTSKPQSSSAPQDSPPSGELPPQSSSPETTKKSGKALSITDAEALIEGYNESRPPNWAKVQRLTEVRRKALNRFWLDCGKDLELAKTTLKYALWQLGSEEWWVKTALARKEESGAFTLDTALTKGKLAQLSEAWISNHEADLEKKPDAVESAAQQMSNQQEAIAPSKWSPEQSYKFLNIYAIKHGYSWEAWNRDIDSRFDAKEAKRKKRIVLEWCCFSSDQCDLGRYPQYKNIELDPLFRTSQSVAN